MTIKLRQSTASQEIPLGYFVDSTDGNTEETGLTIANTDIKIWKAGATTLANKNSGGATHISNGIYYAVLDATDTDTVGPLVVFCHVSGALTVRQECEVFEEAVYDALFAASAPGYVANAPVNVAQISGDSTAADNAEAFFDGTGYAGTNNVIPTVTTLTNLPAITANWLTAAGIASDVTTELQNGLATASAVSTLQTSVDDLPTNAELATALAAADDAVLAQVALVKVKTDQLSFTVANQVDANIQYVNDVAVTGDGQTGTEWGPA